MAVHEMFPYICAPNAAAALEFYVKAFGATEKLRLVEPSGRIGHAELDFGGTVLMLADEFPECGFVGPKDRTSAAFSIHLHVDNADETIARAVELGAQIERAPKDEFYGERSGVIRDPFGHRWMIGHSIEEVTAEEMQRRYTEMLSGSGA